jgi:hypothetical protein
MIKIEEGHSSRDRERGREERVYLVCCQLMKETDQRKRSHKERREGERVR